jgi:hypothetical protein
MSMTLVRLVAPETRRTVLRRTPYESATAASAASVALPSTAHAYPRDQGAIVLAADHGTRRAWPHPDSDPHVIIIDVRFQLVSAAAYPGLVPRG